MRYSSLYISHEYPTSDQIDRPFANLFRVHEDRADPFKSGQVILSMSIGPPFKPDDNCEWDNWREKTTRLQYPDRDIRIIFPKQQGGTVHEPKSQPAEFGDFDPNNHDPDPEVWPLENLDPGYPADIDELYIIQNPFPAPHVAWVTEEYLEARYGYNPVRQEVDIDELPVWAQPKKTEDNDTVKIDATNDGELPLSLTDDRREALTRLAQLWNGETVRGHHLLLDKCPGWGEIFDDLNQDELQRLVVDPDADPRLAEAFNCYDWFEQEQSIYLKPKRILRKKVWYAPTQRGRTLINAHTALPSLRGDPNEGLVHRVTVGLAALREKWNAKEIGTYYNLDVNEYNVDLLSRDASGQLYAGEVMTGHNNWALHRRTYEKLSDLRARNIIPHVVFDSRKTAYKVFNHWHRKGLAQLPRGPFDSEYGIEDGRKRIEEAYKDEQSSWDVADWTTTAALWRNTLGRDGPGIDRNLVTSINW